MANKKYSDYIEISKTFESVVDIDADTRNKNMWREYIVGEDMEKMMKGMCQSLNKEEPDSRRSFWIEGTYGTGKSYAAILIKHLMEEPSNVVDDYLARNSRLASYRNRFMKCRAKDKGDYLVIWKTGCNGIRDGNAMLMAAEKAVREALAAKFGDRADFGEFSLQDAVMQKVKSPDFNWEYVLEHSVLGDDYNSVEELRKSLEKGDICALQKTAAVIRQKGWGLVDSLDTFKKWIASVIENNGLSKSGIFFIWDEFTEYLANSDDQTILQQLSEFCKVQPFFMLFVVHRTTAMADRITPERYQLITHRFHNVEFHISTEAAFDLIAGSINVRNGMFEHWKEERKELCAISHKHGAIFHTDAVQALGHILVDVKSLGIDMMSCSAHKFNGPKGIGFLFIKKGTKLSAYVDGGTQEFGRRAGTENVASIVGMSVALQKNVDRVSDFQSQLLSLEQRLLDKLNSASMNYRRNGAEPRVPGNLSLSFFHADGEGILHRLDLMGIMVSTGAACDSRSTRLSHVLSAIHVDETYAKGTIRISVGKENTVNDVEKIADAIIRIVPQQHTLLHKN